MPLIEQLAVPEIVLKLVPHLGTELVPDLVPELIATTLPTPTAPLPILCLFKQGEGSSRLKRGNLPLCFTNHKHHHSVNEIFN